MSGITIGGVKKIKGLGYSVAEAFFVWQVLIQNTRLDPIYSRSPPSATLSFAARNRTATSSLICEDGNLWPQVEDQGGADQTEAQARRDECNQHRGGKARKDDE